MVNQHNAFYQSVTTLIQSGKYDKAIIDLEIFLGANPDDEVARSILGSALIRSGDQDKAIATLKHNITLYPKSFAAHADLAFVSMNIGSGKQAIESFEKATKLNQKFYQAWAFLGKLYFEEGQYEDALKAVDLAEKNDPLDDDYRKMQKFMRDGDFAKGEKIAREMLKKMPGHPRAGFMLAHIASKVEAHAERADILNHCLSYHPANLVLRKEVVLAYEEIGDYERALIEAKILVKTAASYLNHWVLSRVYGYLGDHENSLRSAEMAALSIDDNNDELGKVDLLRAHALRTLGRREESEAAYKSCIKNIPDNGAGWAGLADFKNYKFSADDKQAMESLITNDDMDDEQRCLAAFALAKAFDNEGHKEKSFVWYKRANDLRPDLKFTAEKNIKFCDNRIAAFDDKMLKQQAFPTPTGPTPIFIIGMPRAGSTLIEQILASHSQIEGTMELSTLPNLEQKIKISGGQKFKKYYPESLSQFSKKELSDFGQEYIDKTAVYRTDKPYFIDKLPPNFERIGLIHKIMPHAIIIDARRHPLDCGYSAFRQHFAAGHDYSYDLDHIGNYYNGYLRFMDHWGSVLPGKVICVQYENMVHKTEATVKSILSHIGVNFEESCLRFFENKRAVKTASSEQVRQPIYTKGIGQWQGLEEQLAPLIESLGEDTMARFEEFLPK